MSESLKTRLMRWRFNLFPPYRRTGARITYISRDWRETHIKLPLNWKTRNYVGTIFGGSIYAAADPIYMVMFIKLLGPGYIVWDKEAHIWFKCPGRSTLHARLKVEDQELHAIREELKTAGKLERTYRVELVDEKGKVCAVVEKVLYFRAIS
jgi:acyl-coenzyme A thioesterase PaaI-like protein